MHAQKERTLKVYKEAGAWVRLYKDVSTQMLSQVVPLLPKTEKDKLLSAVNKINAIISNADDGLFRDFPDIGNKGCNIFYGSLKNAPRDELDEEIIALAEKDAQSLFDIRERK